MTDKEAIKKAEELKEFCISRKCEVCPFYRAVDYAWMDCSLKINSPNRWNFEEAK